MPDPQTDIDLRLHAFGRAVFVVVAFAALALTALAVANVAYLATGRNLAEQNHELLVTKVADLQTKSADQAKQLASQDSTIRVLVAEIAALEAQVRSLGGIPVLIPFPTAPTTTSPNRTPRAAPTPVASTTTTTAVVSPKVLRTTTTQPCAVTVPPAAGLGCDRP